MKAQLAWVFAFALLAIGCKESDDDSLGGIDSTESLADLDEAELREVCEAARDRIEDAAGGDYQRGSCLLGASVSASIARGLGGTAADVEQLCGDEFEACLDADADESSCNLGRPSSDCEATVADYARCARTAGETLSLLAESSCEEVVEADFMTSPDGGLGSDIDECDALLEPCLNSLGASGEGDGGFASDGGGLLSDASLLSDAGGPTTTCCAPGDPCSFADDDFCDCVNQSWDEADCASNPPIMDCCVAGDPCEFANDAFCDCADQSWDEADCSGG